MRPEEVSGSGGGGEGGGEEAGAAQADAAAARAQADHRLVRCHAYSAGPNEIDNRAGANQSARVHNESGCSRSFQLSWGPLSLSAR